MNPSPELPSELPSTNLRDSPWFLGIALAPALIGIISLVLGAGVFVYLTEQSESAEEAGVRLFGALFVLFGLWLMQQGWSAAMGAGRRHDRRVLPLALGLLVYAALVLPFNLWWRAPWTAFQLTVWLLDVIGVILLVRLARRVWQRQRPAPADRRAPRAKAAPLARRRWAFAMVLFGILGVIVGWLAAQNASADWRSWSSLRRVEGVVVRQHSFNFRAREGGQASQAAAVVQYTVEGKRYESLQRMDPASPSFRKGAQVVLIYNPARPGVAQLATAFDMFLISGVLLVITIVFLGIASVSAVRATQLR